MTPPDAYTALKAIHVAAALAFGGGVLANALVLASTRALAPDAARIACSVAFRWSRSVTTPAMLIVWAAGLVIGIEGGWFSELWLQAKLAGVLILSGLHGAHSGALRRRSAGGASREAGGHALSAALVALGCMAAIAVLAVTKIG